MSPERTCVVCRETCTKGELIRFVLTEQGLKADLSQRADGRGAYLHLLLACIEGKGVIAALMRSLKRGEVSKTLKSNAKSDASQLRGLLFEAAEKDANGLLAGAIKKFYNEYDLKKENSTKLLSKRKVRL